VTVLTGLGALELSVLAAVGESKGSRRTPVVLEELEREGIAPVYAMRVLQDLLAPWQRHLTLLHGEGNWGSVGNDPRADPRYTAVALSHVGRLALAAERGEVSPVPLGLIDGTLYAGGRVPPFNPQRVVEALQQGSKDAGPPALPTGGEVAGELPQLLAGKKARLQLGPRVVHEPGALVITGHPLGVNRDTLAEHLARRVAVGAWAQREADGPAGHHAASAPPVLDVRDESDMFVGTRIVCLLVPQAEPGAAEQWVRGVWPVTVEIDCRLPAPQRVRLRDWARGDSSGLHQLARLLL